jgi:hypothetical protein
MLKAEHALSERQRPRAHDLKASMPDQRADLITWMIQAFDVMSFEESILHSVALTIDRYCAHPSKKARRIETSMLQPLLLSALSVDLKTSNALEYPEISWKRLLSHLGQGKVEVVEILRAEQELLDRLDYIVCIPTPLTFLQSLLMRRREERRVEYLRGVAGFLLELALFDVELQYGYPHTILAAGAVSAAMRVINGARGPDETMELLEDVNIYLDPARDPTCSTDTILACEQDLLLQWCRCTQLDTLQAYAKSVEKFLSKARRWDKPATTPAQALAMVQAERCSSSSLDAYVCYTGGRPAPSSTWNLLPSSILDKPATTPAQALAMVQVERCSSSSLDAYVIEDSIAVAGG